jgi:hypothetical protein
MCERRHNYTQQTKIATLLKFMNSDSDSSNVPANPEKKGVVPGMVLGKCKLRQFLSVRVLSISISLKVVKY